MNPLAEELNQIVAQCNPNILDMLSGIGKQLYFPKGILSQGAFLFAFSPGFLLGGPDHIMPWYQVISTMITIILGTIAFGSLTMGYFLCPTTILEWIICGVATLILFFPHMIVAITGIDAPTFIVDAAGIGLWVLVFFMQKFRIRNNPTLTLPIQERKKLKRAAA